MELPVEKASDHQLLLLSPLSPLSLSEGAEEATSPLALGWLQAPCMKISAHPSISVARCFLVVGQLGSSPAPFQVSTHLLPWVYPCMVSAQAYLHGHLPGGFCAVKQPEEAEPRIWSRFQYLWDSLRGQGEDHLHRRVCGGIPRVFPILFKT